jgi:predicted transcriptional regulator
MSIAHNGKCALGEDDDLDALMEHIAQRTERRRRVHPAESREASLVAVAKEMIAEGGAGRREVEERSA